MVCKQRVAQITEILQLKTISKADDMNESIAVLGLISSVGILGLLVIVCCAVCQRLGQYQRLAQDEVYRCSHSRMTTSASRISATIPTHIFVNPMLHNSATPDRRLLNDRARIDTNLSLPKYDKNEPPSYDSLFPSQTKQ